MIVASRQRAVTPRLSRFAWLMALYAENYTAIQRIIDVARIDDGRWVSHVGDGMDLHVDVLTRHRFMLELRMSYGFVDPLTGRPDPSAYVRVYTDARLAEVTHCYIGRRWQDVLGLNPSTRTVFAHRMRMNTFLSKWLGHLHDAGHCKTGLLPGPSEISLEQAIIA